MGFGLQGVLAHPIVRSVLAITRTSLDVPKGYLAVKYVGEYKKKRLFVQVSYLNQLAFKDLLSLAEEEFGFDRRMGGLTKHCKEDMFLMLSPAAVEYEEKAIHLPQTQFCITDTGTG